MRQVLGKRSKYQKTKICFWPLSQWRLDIIFFIVIWAFCMFLKKKRLINFVDNRATQNETLNSIYTRDGFYAF